MLSALASTMLVSTMLVSTMLVAQPARIGRLRVLAPLRPSLTRCQPAAADADLRSQGVASLILASDSTLSRTVSLARTADGHPKMLIAMMSDSTGPKRRELETVTIAFDVNGRIVKGDRTAMTMGSPTTFNDTRRSGLLPTDTAPALALVAGIRACALR